MKKLLFLLLMLPGAVWAACPDPVPTNTLCLEWQAPTENVDGSPLTDLAGFEVFWGFSSGDFDDTRKIDIPDATQVELTTPATPIIVPTPPGGGMVTIFFVMTAYDEGVLPGPTVNCQGDPSDDANDPTEVDCRSVSAFSNQVGKPISFPDLPPGEPTILNIIINIQTS